MTNGREMSPTELLLARLLSYGAVVFDLHVILFGLAMAFAVRHIERGQYRLAYACNRAEGSRF